MAWKYISKIILQIVESTGNEVPMNDQSTYKENIPNFLLRGLYFQLHRLNFCSASGN